MMFHRLGESHQALKHENKLMQLQVIGVNVHRLKLNFELQQRHNAGISLGVQRDNDVHGGIQWRQNVLQAVR